MPMFNRTKKKAKKNRQKRQEAPKPCRFTRDEVFEVDYREVDVLRRFISAQGKIGPQKRNSIAANYQRQLKVAIKRARFLALLPCVGQ
jgi:small subunit ribosomal protein S18